MVLPAGATEGQQDLASSAESQGFFELVGHEPLMNRGMNAAIAVHGDYAYVGSRTDGKPASQNLTHGGVMIVDVTDPAQPAIAAEMGPPNEGNAGESSRELRVWRSQDILMILHTNCGPGTPTSVRPPR